MMGPTGCLETSVKNYQSTMREIPTERRIHWHNGGSLKIKQYYCRLHTNIL